MVTEDEDSRKYHNELCEKKRAGNPYYGTESLNRGMILQHIEQDKRALASLDAILGAKRLPQMLQNQRQAMADALMAKLAVPSL